MSTPDLSRNAPVMDRQQERRLSFHVRCASGWWRPFRARGIDIPFPGRRSAAVAAALCPGLVCRCPYRGEDLCGTPVVGGSVTSLTATDPTLWAGLRPRPPRAPPRCGRVSDPSHRDRPKVSHPAARTSQVQIGARIQSREQTESESEPVGANRPCPARGDLRSAKWAGSETRPARKKGTQLFSGGVRVGCCPKTIFTKAPEKSCVPFFPRHRPHLGTGG